MGWVCESDPSHEGYPVALVAEDRGNGYVRFRELGYPDAVDPIRRVRFFQVGCECGWRSRRFYAPLTASYSPHSLDLGDAGADDEARAIWVRHVGDANVLELQRRERLARFTPATTPAVEDLEPRPSTRGRRKG